MQQEAAYYTFRAELIALCSNPDINIKQTKILVDHVKQVIKGGKKYTADHKLRALRLLHKCIMKATNNPVFIDYVQITIMGRLAILATFCPKG